MPPIHQTTNAATSDSTTFPSIPLRAQDSFQDDIVERLAYQRCGDGDDFDSEAAAMMCAESAQESCSRFAAFQENYLGPISPERAPATWMVLNAFCLSWSISLGLYLMLLYIEHGNETAGSKSTTTLYLVYSVTTTLVWVAEIYLRTVFAPLETIVVVTDPAPSDEEDAPQNNLESKREQPTETPQQIYRTFTAEESVVTLETIVQRRSNKQFSALLMELLLALFFWIQSVIDCWKYWNHRYGNNATDQSADDDGDDYYMYDGDNEVSYSILQQQSDIWINVLAYTYMTYHTYHEYYKARTNHRDIQRSFSSTLLNHQHFQQSLQQQEQSTTRRPGYPQQHFPRTHDTRTNTAPSMPEPPVTNSSANTYMAGRITVESTSSSEDEGIAVDYTATISTISNSASDQEDRAQRE